MHKLSQYEDCIQMNFPINKDAINLETLNWVKYNPRKDINRFGCSITSIDGSDSGIPDLDSLMEHNLLYGTQYIEKDFKTPTKHAEPFLEFLNLLQVGRSHYLKLPPGGFFPWHRDSDPLSFRIIYTIQNCTTDSLIWLEDDRIIPLQNHCWYYINTKKKHALFSFNESIMAVFNVLFDGKTFNTLERHMHIK